MGPQIHYECGSSPTCSTRQGCGDETGLAYLGKGARDCLVNEAELEELWPGLRGSGYKITSERTEDYNCIAWAAERADAWWSPVQDYYWPEGVARELTLEAFGAAYETLGYSRCDSSAYEPGFLKVAIYVDQNGIPTHVARQFRDGSWTSKLGGLEDIRHLSLDHLAGQTEQSYGTRRRPEGCRNSA